MHRIACAWIPHFVAEIELQRNESATSPLIVCDGKHVLDSCAQAAAEGVGPEDLLHQALARCPDAHIVQADDAHYQGAWERIVETLELHSPVVEAASWGVAYLDARGMGVLYGSESSWCQAVRQGVWQGAQMKAQVGVADSKFSAWVAARECSSESGCQVVGQSDRSYLASLPVGELPLPNEARRRLYLLGIRTAGQFARLPHAAVAEQLGPESLKAHQWSRGEDQRPLLGQRCKALEVHCEFDAPENRQRAIIGAVLGASSEALSHLHRNGLTTRRVVMEIQLDGGEWLKRSAWIGALLGPKRFHTLLENLLGNLEGDGVGVMEVRLKLIGLEPMIGGQLSLFAHTEGRLRLEETLHKLVQKHSPRCVFRACVRVPDAPLIKDRYALEEFPI
jgi:nucleotidyltransferase/DNA polymerase involved in DNA repair